jgi:hypothetical protein
MALDPPGANHHLRTDFTIKDLDVWMQVHRGELLAAILTVGRGWVVAGRPSPSVRSDDYAPWVNGLRGMLGWAGISGTFGGSSSEVAISSDDEEWHAFLVAIYGAFSTAPFTVKELVGQLPDHLVNAGSIDPAALPGDLAEKWSSHIRDGRDWGFRKSVGWWLKNREGRYASGWAVVAAEPDAHAKVARYRVKPPGSAANAGQDEGQDSEGDESAGLRGFAGLNPATRERENSHLSSNGHGERPGENPQNPATPQTDCQTCGAGLWAPWSQQRGTCEKCWLAKEPTT